MNGLKSSLSDYSLQCIKLAAKQMNLTEKQMEAIFYAKGLSGEELKQALATTTLSATQENAKLTTTGFSTALKGLTSSALSAGKSLLIFLAAHPLLAVLAGGAALIGGVSMAIDAFTTSTEEARKKSEESAQELDRLQSEIGSINSDLEATGRRIDDILSKDNITLTDENELKKLQAQNRELERELRIKQALEKQAQKKASDDATEVFTSIPDNGFWKMKGTTVFYEETRGAGGVGQYQDRGRDRMQATLDYMEQLAQLNRELADLKSEQSQYWVGSPEFNSLNTRIQDKEELTNAVQNELNRYIREFQAEDDELIAGFSAETDAVIAALDEIYSKYDFLMNTAEGTALTMDQRLADKFAGGYTTGHTIDGSSGKSSYSHAQKQLGTWIESLSDDDKKIMLQCEIDLPSLIEAEAYLKTKKEELAAVLPFSYSEENIGEINEYLSKTTTLKGALESIAKGEFDDQSFTQLKLQFKELGEGSNHLSDDIKNLMDKNLDSLYSRLGEGIPPEVRASLDNITESAKHAGESWSILNGQLESIQSAYSALSNAQEEYSQYGALSIDTLQALLNTDSEYLACLIDENGQLVLNNEAYQAMVAAKLADAEATAVTQAIAQLDALTKADQTQRTLDYVNANSILSESLAGLTGNYDAVMTSAAAASQAQALSAAIEGAQDRGADTAQIEQVMSGLNAQLQMIRATSANVTGSFKGLNSAVGGYGTSAEKAKSAAEELTDTLKKQKEELEKTKDKYDDVISAVNWFYDQQIGSVETVIDGIEKQNGQLEKQKDTYDSILSAVDDLYQREIDGLESQIGAVQDKIDALKGANDEQERQIALEKAQYAWEQALQQRTKYLYNGKEFVYTTDREAVADAKTQLEDARLESEVAKLEKEQSALQTTIGELEKYRRKWADISDSYQLQQNSMAAAAYFGYNWESLILQNRLADITSFEAGYNTVQQSINSNQALIDSYNEKIAYYESLKTQWEALTSKYEDEQNIQLLIETFGINYEQLLLEGRTKAWDDFAAQYYNIQGQIAGLSEQIESAVNSAASAAQNAVTSLQKSLEDMNNLKFPDPPVRYYGGGGKMLLETKHSGILDGPVGRKQPDTQKSFETLYEYATNDRLNYDEVIAKLKKGEIVLNESQQKSLAGNILDTGRLITLAQSEIAPNPGLGRLTSLPPYVTDSSQNLEVTQHINMNLPNIRTKDDAGEIAKELSRLYLSGVQYFNRRQG